MKNGRTKVTSILFLFKHKISDLYVKFYDKSVLSPSFEKKYSHKTSYQNRLSTYMFSLDAAVPQVFDIWDCAIIIRRGGGLKPEGGALHKIAAKIGGPQSKITHLTGGGP